MTKKRKKAETDSTCYVDKTTRTLTISGDIALAMASKFRRLFKQLEHAGTDPITVEINTGGGDEYAGMLIMDTIMLSKCKVITRATGMAMSMGACILLAGDKRECLPMSSIMVHQGTWYLVTRAEEAVIEQAELARWEERLWDLFDDRTGHERGFWKSFCAGKNKYLDAKEAVELKLVDKIVGKG